jgi:hypothetical protein
VYICKQGGPVTQTRTQGTSATTRTFFLLRPEDLRHSSTPCREVSIPIDLPCDLPSLNREIRTHLIANPALTNLGCTNPQNLMECPRRSFLFSCQEFPYREIDICDVAIHEHHKSLKLELRCHLSFGMSPGPHAFWLIGKSRLRNSRFLMHNVT